MKQALGKIKGIVKTFICPDCYELQETDEWYLEICGGKKDYVTRCILCNQISFEINFPYKTEKYETN